MANKPIGSEGLSLSEVDWSRFTPIEDEGMSLDEVDWSKFTPIEDQPKPPKRSFGDVMRGGLMTTLPVASLANSQTARDFTRLVGGGAIKGAGNAVEGVERSIANAFREPRPTRVRFMSEDGQLTNPRDHLPESEREAADERANERMREWHERNPAYQPSRFSQWMKRTGEGIQKGVSPDMAQAMEDSQIDGDILSPSTWTLGKNPSVRGLAGHIAQVGGEMLPIVAAGAVPGVGPGLATLTATGQASAGAYEEARDYVMKADAAEIGRSREYQNLIGIGLSDKEARSILADKAGSAAMGPAGAIGGLSGVILSGAATSPLQRAITNRMGNTFEARLLGNAAEVPLEGAQEVAESVAGRYAANRAADLDRDLTEGTFADAALGAAAAGPAAVAHSISPGESAHSHGLRAAMDEARRRMVEGDRARNDTAIAPKPLREGDDILGGQNTMEALSQAIHGRGPNGPDGPGAAPVFDEAGIDSMLDGLFAQPDSGWRADLESVQLPEPVAADLSARYEAAEQIMPAFESGLGEIAESVGGRAIVAPLKSAARAASKVMGDYEGDASRITDLVRGTIEIQSLDDVDTILGQLQERYGEPVKMKNRFGEGAAHAGGYRYINSVWMIDGQPVEVQINLPEMLEAKEQAHPLYERVQEIDRKADRENRDRTPEEQEEITRLYAEQQAIYEGAWDSAMSRMKSSRDNGPENEPGLSALTADRKSASDRMPLSLSNGSPQLVNLPDPLLRKNDASMNRPDSALNKATGTPQSYSINNASSGRPASVGMGGASATFSASAMSDTSGESVSQQADEQHAMFPPESGTLGIPRTQMPQIKGEHRQGFLRFLAERGIESQTGQIDAAELKPTQADYSPEAVDRFARTGPIGQRSVLVSSDGYVLDGHHQWMAMRSLGQPVDVIQLDAPIRELLDAADAFPHTQRSDKVVPPEAPGDSQVTMQNRDRSRAASVAQMQGIRRNPEPDRLGFSRDPNAGAPMVSEGAAIAEADKGASDVVVMASGRRVPVRYAVVEADALAASHDADGHANPDYDAAPLKALNNGRVAGLQAAWQAGNADAYRDGIMADARLHGVSPEAIAGKRNPVLVRLYDPAENTGDMGAESNASTQLGLSPVEQAQTDARALPDMAGIQWAEDGTLNPAQNAGFFRAFFRNIGAAQAATLQDAQGRPNAQALQRVRAAMVHRAYGDERVLSALVEDANPDNRNIVNALVRAAAGFAQLDQNHPLTHDLRALLTDALETVRDAARRGMSVADAVAQGDLLGRDANADAVAVFMSESARSPRRMAEAFTAMAEYADAAQRQGSVADIFGNAPEPSVEYAIAQANQALREAYGPDIKTIPARAPAPVESGRGESQRDGQRGSAAESSSDPGSGFALAGQSAGADPAGAVSESQGGLFGAPTSADYLDAHRRARDDARNGRTGTGRTDMMAGDGDLFAGPRPEQMDIEGGNAAQSEPKRSNRDDRQRDNAHRQERAGGAAAQRGDSAASTGFASAVPRGLPARRDADSDRLVAAINRHLGSDSRGGFDAQTVQQEGLPDALAEALRLFELATGTRVVIFRNLTPEVEDFNGVNFRDGVVYVNENSQYPLTLTAAHEWLHNLRRTDPDLYQKLVKEVERQGYLRAYQQRLRDEGESRWRDMDLVAEELTAAAVSDALTDPEFLQRMANRSRGLFRRVARAFLDFLNTLTSGWRDQGSNAYLRDVEAFRDKLAEVLDAFENRNDSLPNRGSVDAMFQRVFHGTPHRGIENTGFKLNRIGTGEGAQAYGWGAYFASQREVAEGYRGALSNDVVYLDGKPVEGLDDSRPRDWAIKRLASQDANSLLDWLNQAEEDTGNAKWIEPRRRAVMALREHKIEKRTTGQLYQADIPEDSDLLDWDAPFDKQPQAAQDLWRSLAEGEFKPKRLGANGKPVMWAEPHKGVDLYRQIGAWSRAKYGLDEHQTKQAASLALRDAGIPGLRYLDGNSRANGEGSHNYVIWDEALLTPEAAQITPMYSRKAETKAAYEARIDELFAGARSNYKGVRILDRADMLDLLGHGDKPLHLKESAVRKRDSEGRIKHPGMTLGKWKRLPEWIENPVAVFNSQTVPGALVMIGPELVAGRPVRITLEPNEGMAGLDVHVLTNAYEEGGSHITPVDKWTAKGDLLYLDQKVSPAFSERSGLRLPGEVRQLRGYRRKVLTEADLVKYRSERDTAFERVESPRRRYRNGRQEPDWRQLDLFTSDRSEKGRIGSANAEARRESGTAVRDLFATGSILAQALSSDYVSRQRASLVGQTLTSAEDLATLAQVYRDPRFETLRLIFLDESKNVVSQFGLTSRLPSSAVGIVGDDIEAYMRDMVAAARKGGATSFYMLHNHPSGDATPSRNDAGITKRYAELTDGQLSFEGHVVIDTNHYAVIDRNGSVKTHHKDFGQPEPPAASEWARHAIRGPADLMSMARKIQVDDNAVTLVMADSQLKVRGITAIPRSVFGNRLALRRAIHRAAIGMPGSASVFAIGKDKSALLAAEGLVRDAIHMRPDGRIESLAENREILGSDVHDGRSGARLSPDTSIDFNYLREHTGTKAARRNAERTASVAEPEPPVMFSRKSQTREAYEQRIDELFAGAKPKQPGVKMLDEGDVLTITGYGNMPVTLAEKHAVVDGGRNHPLTAEQWKKVPEWIDNPASAFERQSDGHITLIGPEKIDGKAVVIALEPQMRPVGGRGPSINHLMLTAYAKDVGTMPLRAMLERGDMKPLYIDQKKASSFYAGSGVQFPGSGAELRGFNKSLKTERDLVKYRAERGPMFSRKRDPETLTRQLVGRIEAEVLSRMGSTGEFIADQIHDGFRRDWIDEFIDLQRAEEQTAEKLGIKREDLPDHLQARRQENLRHGAYQDRLGRAERQFFEPVAKILGEANLDREDFADYLWWRHAGERDAYLREKHKTNPGPADLAGIDPKEARANIDALPEATRRAFEKAAEHIDALRQHTLDVLVDSGQIRPEVRDSLLARWQHYVPLRGLPKGEGDPILASYRGGGSGRGLSMLRNPLGKKALGRKSRPSDILEQMHIDLERALIGVEKQKVLKRIIGLIQANPEIGTVDPVKTEKREVNGVIEHVPTKGDVQQQLLYLHNGQPVRIEMSNPYLTQAVLNMNEPVHAIIRFWSYITRWMSSVWTAYSPYFMLINPVRDMEFAALGIGAEHGRKALRKAAKFYPQTFKALHRDAKGEPMDKDIDRYAREFGLMGGKTGYTIVNDIGAMRSKLNRLFRKERKGLSPAKVWSNLMDFTEAANGYAENSARLAVFAALRDSGVSAEKAAEYAKNITVNFNKKGRLSKHVNMAYMFFNAAVQGTVRVANLARNRTFRNTMVALVGASYATALMQMIAMGDDDDGESLYLKRVTDGARLRTIPFPFLDEEWIAIPIPYGPNFFNYLGNKMAEVTYEQMRGRPVDPGKVAGQILSAASQSFSPISVEDGVKAWQPSAIRVLNNFLSGTDDRGRPLNYTAHYEGESNAPKFLMGNASTGAGFKAFARFLNNWSGGSDYEAGWLNFTPEQLRYVTENGLGGMYRLGTESYELMEKMLTDDKIRPQDVPLSNVFLRSRSIDRQQQESYFDKREKTKDLKRQFAQAHERQDQAAMDKLLSEHPWLRGSQLPASHRLGKMAQAGTPVGALRRTESAIRDLRKQREAAYLRTGQYEGITLTESRAELRRIDGLIAEQQKRFTTVFNRAEGRGMVE